MSDRPTRAPLTDRERIVAILIGSAGNLVEWYDFYVYAAFSLYFADAFFPGDDPVAQMLSASGIFALGFLMRPIGAYVFGRIGDGHGRRLALMLAETATGKSGAVLTVR